MNILHVVPHLGGGVGKAHASISDELPAGIKQTFLLLEAPRDRRFVDSIAAVARVVVADDFEHVDRLAAAADIVQFEFWNHPRLLECLARCAFPAMRSLFWSHVSGLSTPVIPPGLMEQAGRFVFTTQASLGIAAVERLAASTRKKISVINSGFGFADAARSRAPRGRKPVIAYLGTVDFVKMHPGFFDAIDRLEGAGICVPVWGEIDPSGDVPARASSMQHPERVRFRGQTADPAAALSDADIFFYPLQRDHYGTAENALIEAMSLGLVPVVLNNPAEMAIVRDGETGFVGHSIDECAALLQQLLSSPERLKQVSRNAAREVAKLRTPARAAKQFTNLWREMLGEPPSCVDFRSVLGENPADWFIAMQPPAERERRQQRKNPEAASKGTLAHFESVFAGDASLARLQG